MYRSCVKVEGKDSSATLQPFYTLQLDIQDPAVHSVTDALQANFASEKLDGFVCGKTKLEVEATRSNSLEELPPVLILHMKRFVYDGATGGVQKVMKQVEFGAELEVSKAVLSAECRAATSARQRQYRLYSVVCHNGREATKGHYVTDVFHPGYATWLHCDDGTVQPTAEELVLAPSASSTPYILFYRRGDTL
jgi:ubiquitin carboxyl-terminal hydrolase 10